MVKSKINKENTFNGNQEQDTDMLKDRYDYKPKSQLSSNESVQRNSYLKIISEKATEQDLQKFVRYIQQKEQLQSSHEKFQEINFPPKIKEYKYDVALKREEIDKWEKEIQAVDNQTIANQNIHAKQEIV